MERDSWIKEFVISLSSKVSMVVHCYIKYYKGSKYHLQLIKTIEDGKILCLVFGRDLILYDSKTKQTVAVDDKLQDGTKEKLWIYEIEPFNFGSLRKILGVND